MNHSYYQCTSCLWFCSGSYIVQETCRSYSSTNNASDCCCWIQKPVDADFELMTDDQSERDIMLRIAHHQYYWQQRNENERQRRIWTSMFNENFES